MNTTLFLDPEHEMLRDQVRRFVAERVRPFADQWEADGMVPRAVLREMQSAAWCA